MRQRSAWTGAVAALLVVAASCSSGGGRAVTLRTVRVAGPHPLESFLPAKGADTTDTGCGAPVGCAHPIRGHGLVFRDDHRVSTDGGRRWHPVVVTPEQPRGVARALRITPVHRDADGWIASGASEVGDRSYGFLLRSTDGVRWHSEAPVHCYDRPVGLPATAFTPPVRTGGRWWSLLTCSDRADRVSGLLLASDDGARWRTVHDFGTRPVTGLFAARGRLVLPVPDPRTFAITSVVVVTP